MIKEGVFLGKRYEILGRIGSGGMADVYKGKDHKLNRFVAIKVLKSTYRSDETFIKKFLSEAQAAAGLMHPNVVNVYDVGQDRGLYYMVMELVEGITLKDYIEKKGKLSAKETISISIQMVTGIQAAHNCHIIHRDIKPQNIIISTEGKVKVTDFGIARAASSNTISSDVMGSVHYSSPEQARNGFVDGKSDIYSLGIVMYEMVTGRVPFDGDTTVAVAIQHLQEEIVPPSAYAPNLPISMEKIILKCTQKNPDRRYESMTALLTDLRKALVSPNEDFVVMVPATNQDKTRIIGEDDLKQIKEEADSLYLKADQAVHARAEEMKRYDEDEDDAEDEDDDELEDEDDGDLNPKMEKAITIMGIVAAVVIVIIIIVIVANLFGGIKSKKQSDTETSRTETTQTESQNEDKVTVPDFRGMTYADAQTKAEKKGLKLENKGEVSSDDYDEGEIANQDPESGKEVEEGTTIGVVISNGKGSVEVPSVTGDSEDDAVSALEKEGFKPNKTYAYDDSVEEGKVISQTPSAGDKAKTGDTITIVISQGAEAVTVPDVKTTYKSEEQARDLLSDFNVTVKTAYSDSYPEGIVMDQSIDPGKQVEKGSDITITVSMGPSPSQSVTATTYSFKATINLPGDTSNVSGATITLYDTSGNVLGQWNKAITDDFSISKTGLLAKEGYLVISWLDLNGNKINDQTTSTYQFTPES